MCTSMSLFTALHGLILSHPSPSSTGQGSLFHHSHRPLFPVLHAPILDRIVKILVVFLYLSPASSAPAPSTARPRPSPVKPTYRHRHLPANPLSRLYQLRFVLTRLMDRSCLLQFVGMVCRPNLMACQYLSNITIPTDLMASMCIVCKPETWQNLRL